ncbi:MAG: hypothetical protein IJ723_06970, partial [Ruminococcus sp.]|nr:hypothetical protein [Ruminococcus sp.]
SHRHGDYYPYRSYAAGYLYLLLVLDSHKAEPDAVKKIDGVPMPDIPMLMFVSDGKETGIEKWSDIQKEYASELSNATVIELDCGHYVHNYKQEQISEKMKEFIGNIK